MVPKTWRASRRGFVLGVSGPIITLAAALGLSLSAPLAEAQSYGQFVREANDKTITIVAGPPGQTSLKMAHDLSTVLHCVDGLRIVPMAGRGDKNNVYDLLFLRGVDMAVVRADVMNHLEKSGEFTGALKERIVYVAPIVEEEVHLIAPESVKSLKDLAGQIVNIGPPGSMALAAKAALKEAGVQVVETKFDNALALERVIDGGIKAMFLVAGKPSPQLKQLETVSGLRLLPLPTPNDPAYKSAVLEQSDYPTLAPPGRPVETFAVQSVLAVYNWPTDNARHAKNELFTKALFKRESYLRRPARHPKWRSASLYGNLDGWRQFEPAKALAEAAKSPSAAPPVVATSISMPQESALEEMFQRQLQEFGIQPRTPEERALLFAAFKRRMEASTR